MLFYMWLHTTSFPYTTIGDEVSYRLPYMLPNEMNCPIGSPTYEKWNDMSYMLSFMRQNELKFPIGSLTYNKMG